VRLLLDEHISPAVAVALRASGYEVLSVVECHLRTRDDETIWSFALAEG